MGELPISFETKDFAGVALVLTGTTIACVVLFLSQRLREAALFCIAAGAVLSEKLDVNFYSAYWYRGTTRGFELTFVDVLAFALLVATVLRPQHGQTRLYWPGSLGPMLLFILFAVGSTAMAAPQVFGWFEVTKLLRGLVVFMAAALFVRRERELAIVLLGLAAAVCLEGAFALRQRVFGGIYRITGTLGHPNSVSMYLCLVAPVLVAGATAELPQWLRRVCWVAVGVASGTIILTISRAGLPIFAAVVGGATVWCMSWRLTLKKALLGVLFVGAIGALTWKSWDVIMARYAQASLEQEYLDDTSEGRGYYFRQVAVILAEQPEGVGLNNWSYWVSKKYGAMAGMRYQNYDDVAFPPPEETLYMFRYAAPAHALVVLTVGELGWWGLGVFMLLWLRWLQMGTRFLFKRSGQAWHRLGVGIFFGFLGAFLQSVTEWTFRQTQIFLTFHLLAGTLASLGVWRSERRTRAVERKAPVNRGDWRPAEALPAGR